MFQGFRELKIVNIESLFFAFLLGFTLYENGTELLWCAVAALALILILMVFFRFRIGYYIVSFCFSAFWAYGFSSGWLRDGNWMVGGLFMIVIFAASMYGHKVNYEDNQERESEE